MAKENHKDLANAIKNVHLELRLEARKIGEEKAWLQHCKRTEVLQNYAQAMQQLATVFWDKNADDGENKKAISRVQWIKQQCEDYYFGGQNLNALQREISLCLRYNLPTDNLVDYKQRITRAPETLKVLDVGSCYNPFQKFLKFDVVAVDIAPACNDVLKCDFLNLRILDKGVKPLNLDGEITELTSASFDVVIFSLLLEYLPSPKQRYTCCRKASMLLAEGGILCIITPDSKHATANSGIMKKWKYALANEGLLRIEYNKLPHLHCMVYRKCVQSTLSNQWLSSTLSSDMKKGKLFPESPEQLIVIPQDFHTYSDKGEDNIVPEVRDEDVNIASIFSNLPAL